MPTTYLCTHAAIRRSGSCMIFVRPKNRNLHTRHILGSVLRSRFPFPVLSAVLKSHLRGLILEFRVHIDKSSRRA